MLHKNKSPNIKIRQKHITYMSLLLNIALIGIFSAIFYLCKLGAIHSRKSNFILTFLLEGCLVNQVYQFQYLRSHTPSFWGYKMIK